MILRFALPETIGLIHDLARRVKSVARLGAVCVLGNVLLPVFIPFAIQPLISLQPLRDTPGCISPVNPIVAENCQPGTTDWIVKNFSSTLTGYASPSSVNIGETVKFFVTSHSSSFSIVIYRTGYYQGTGGRLMLPVQSITGKVQPDCYSDRQTGLVSCTNWTASLSQATPTNWVSGIYIAKLSDQSGDNFIVFTVRDDARKSDILFQQSMFTAQGYNNFGGKSVYDFNSKDTCLTAIGLARSVQVSFNRPLVTGDMALAAEGSGYFRAEYAMVRWLESQGYDVTYSNTLDTHDSGKPGARNKLLDHKVFISSGHDEYWSQEMHDAITAARDAGVNIAFLSGNTSYWRVRLESDPVTGAPDSIMTIYKTTESGPADPSGNPTTTWRDRQGANNPENGLIGTEYVGDNDGLFFPLQISAAQASDRIYRNTGLAALAPNTAARIGKQLIGWEWDAVVNNGHSPAGLAVLSNSPVFGFLLQDDGKAANGALGEASTQMTRYQTPGGAIVFSTGTILWSWGLGAQGITVTDVDPVIQQTTYNVFVDMHVQPATPASAIVLDSANSNAKPTVPNTVRVVADTGANPVFSAIQANASGNTVTITWHTDLSTNGQVWFGDTPDHPVTVSTPLKTFTQDHTFNATLAYNKTFYFRIGASDQDGRLALSDVQSFATGSPSFRTGLSQDVKSVISSSKCWIQANPVGTAGIGALLVIIVVMAGILIINRIRHTRRKIATA